MMVFYENKPLYDKIIDRLTAQEQRYSKWRKAHDKIAQIFRPDLGTESDKDGDFFGYEIYEGTPPCAVDTMATAFQGNTVSKSIDWISYAMGDYNLRGLDKLDIWCQDIRDHQSSVYRRSNFYDVQPQFAKNAFSIGSPVMFGEEDIATGRIMWMPVYYKHAFLFYDRYNESDGIIVKDTEWTAKQVFDTFINMSGESGKAEREKKLSVITNNAIEQGRFNDRVTIIRAVFKYNDPIWNGTFKKPAGNYKWISVYFEVGTKEENKNTPLNENMGYHTQPYVYWDYDKKPYESCSRTPAFSAIWDAQSLYTVHKNFLANVQGKNFPAVMALNTMRGRLDLGPDGLTYVEKDEYQSPPKSLGLIGDVVLNKETSDLLAQSCERWFHLSEFRAFNNLVKTNKQPVSALQILKMAAENSVLLSPAIESQGRYLKIVDDRTMGIEIEAGRGPFAPDVMGNIIDIVMSNSKVPVNSIDVVPEFISQLGRAQKISQALDPIMTGIDIAADIAGKVDPDLVMAIRGYGALDDAYSAIGFPKKNFMTEEEYNAAKEFVQKQRAEQVQQAQAIELMKASKNLQTPVDKDSILAGIGKAMAQ